MPQARLNQPSYVGGELATSLHARVDLAKYRTGLALCRNWFIHAHGGVSNRPGLSFIAECKDSTRTAALVRFEFSNDDTYVLEFGHLYLRVFRNGAPVVYSSGPNIGQVYELATPYAEADLLDLYMEQSNDVVTITHQAYAIRELKRLAHDNWTLGTVSFVPTMPAPTGVAGTATKGFTGTNYFPLDDTYVVTAVDKDGNESVASSAVTLNNDLTFRPNYNTITWTAVAGADKYGVFKGSNGIYGLIGFTPNTSFKDDNISANLADTPPGTRNPFATENPATVAFYQQRRLFGSTPSKPQSVFGSQSGQYANFGVSTPVKPNDAFEFAIAARSLQKILHMVPVEDLIIFTPSGEWKASGAQEQAVTPSDIQLKPQSSYGASKRVRPLVIGSQILFVQAKGQTVRDIAYSFQDNKYVGNDLTILANHLFKGRTIKRWAFAQAPHSIVWVVLDNGQLVSLTYMREHEVWGWAQHATDGKVEDVTVVSEGQEDVPYFIVRRLVNGTWRRFIERMHTRNFRTVKDAFFVDCGLSYDVPRQLTGLAYTGGRNRFLIDTAAAGLAVGDTVELETLQATDQGQAFDGQVVIDTLDATGFTGTWATTGGQVAVAAATALGLGVINVRRLVTTVSGLNHLEGRQVVGLVDGSEVGVDNPLTVTGGSVTLPFAGARVHLGLAYVAELTTLSMEPGQQTEMGQFQSVPRVTLQVENMRGLEVRPDGSGDYYEAKLKGYGAPLEPLELVTGSVEVLLAPQWERQGRVDIRQRYPLPATILAHVPVVEYAA